MARSTKSIKKVNNEDNIDRVEDITIGANKEDIVIINPQLQSKIDNLKESKDKEEEVVMVKPQQPKVATTMVRVKLKQNHRCNIGGEWYSFTEGKVYNVPSQVKDILIRADLLLPM